MYAEVLVLASQDCQGHINKLSRVKMILGVNYTKISRRKKNHPNTSLTSVQQLMNWYVTAYAVEHLYILFHTSYTLQTDSIHISYGIQNNLNYITFLIKTKRQFIC